MGILKTLITGSGEETNAADNSSPEQAPRSAAEAAIDRMIAERAAQSAANPAEPLQNAHQSTYAALAERRAGPDRRQVTIEPLGFPDRRAGGDRRLGTSPTHPQPTATFGRRAQRPN